MGSMRQPNLAALVAVLSAVAAGQLVSCQVTVAPTPDFNPAVDMFSTSAMDPVPSLTQMKWELAYDPPTESVVAIALAMVPGSQDAYLFTGRHFGLQSERFNFTEYISAVLEMNAPGGPTITNITGVTDPFCSISQQTSDGKLLVIGGSQANGNGFGEGYKSIRLYDYYGNKTELKEIATMAVGRWYPTSTLMPDKSVLIQGGTTNASEVGPNSTIFERWYPDDPGRSPPVSYPIDLDYLVSVGQNFYPFDVVLPTGDVLIHQDNKTMFLKETGEYREVEGIPPWPAGVATQWPRSAAPVLGALTYENGYSQVDIIILGGGVIGSLCGFNPARNTAIAQRTIYTLRMNWTLVDGEPVYGFPDGAWLEEDMGIPRTGGDATLLPSGDIVLTSGAQRGCHSSSARGQARDSYPAFWPILYQPGLPFGQRVTVMHATPIARMYHHTAALTLSGAVMVAGCDACEPTPRFTEFVDPLARTWWSPGPTGRREFRTELLWTPFALDYEYRPAFVSLRNDTNATGWVSASYGEEVSVSWRNDNSTGPLVKVTGVSLVAPSSSTHGVNNNQRVVKLEITSYVEEGDTGTLTVLLPPDANVAPPQFYMLFLLNGQTNSRARWLRLE